MIKRISFLLAVITLFSVLQFHFIPLLLSILITYLTLSFISENLIKLPYIKSFGKHHEKMKDYFIILTSGVIASLFVFILFLIGSKTFSLFSSSNAMLLKFLSILDNIKQYFPPDTFPDSVSVIKNHVIDFVKNHLGDIGVVGKHSVTVLLYIVIGFVVGVMLKFHVLHNKSNNNKELAVRLSERIHNFYMAFQNVFVAQIKISAINTLLTAIYLCVVLPIFGVKLPFLTAIVVFTFVAGLIPVIGNLLSNTLIIVFSINVSLAVALSSLLFLVIIHKLEYFLNAKIIGNTIDSTAWELLLAMLVFEHLFGISGVIVAPIYYAYLKIELKKEELI